MRIRTIKPSFFVNDRLAELPAIARLLFIGLWSLADRRGRLEDRPKRIKASVLPYDEIDISEALDQLAEGGFLARYSVGPDRYIQIAAFEKHQRITGKEAEAESIIPAPPAPPGETTGKHSGSNGETLGILGSPDVSASESVKQSGNTGETTETTGREGNGKEGEGVAPPVFEPPTSSGWLPESLRCPEFLRLWSTWEDHCRERGSTLTTGARRAQLCECERAGLVRSTKVINASINKNSRGTLYWDFDQRPGAGTAPPRKKDPNI